MKTVYQYDHEGVYTGEGIAHEDPMVPGRFALPAFSTETPPPAAVAPGQAAVYNKDKWEILPDHRGKTVYHTATQKLSEVDYVGKIKEGYTRLPPGRFQEWDGSRWVDRPLTAKEKNRVVAEESAKIDAETESQILSGFKFDRKIFSMSLSAQANWLYLLTLYQGGQFPAEFPIATKDDSTYTLTKEQAPKFFQASAAHKESALAEGRKKKAELRSRYEG